LGLKNERKIKKKSTNKDDNSSVHRNLKKLPLFLFFIDLKKLKKSIIIIISQLLVGIDFTSSLKEEKKLTNIDTG
jgi:hypothetical protein